MALEPKEIGRRIAAARDAKGWTQLDLAYEAGKSPSTISRWERGELPTVRELMRIAGILEVPAEQLVEPIAADGAIDPARLDRVEARVEEALVLLQEVRDLALAQAESKPEEPKGKPRARPGS
jgi:transcriptional regulator with XRE-family HTH domain